MHDKLTFKQIFAAVVFLLSCSLSPQTQAVSMYARQTGQACESCHFQHYPLLTEFGRSFKASGYTLTGKQGEIKGENLSIPETLNIGIVSKIRYQRTNGPRVDGTHTSNDGQWDIPDEFNVMIGGRISPNIGFFLEGATVEAPFLASFKIPFTYDVGPVKAGVIPFSTGELGASFGFELLNTGAVKNQRMVEQGADISAQQYIVGEHAARGFAFVASNTLFFMNFTKWSPGHVGDHTSSPDANYFRLGLTPRWGNWDFGTGIQYWGGSAEEGPDSAVMTVDTKAWAVDAQAQGMVGALPLGIYLSHASAPATGLTGGVNFFNPTSGNGDRSATAISAELGVLPRRATVLFAYRVADTGDLLYSSDNALTLGGTYQIVQNMQLQLTHTLRRGSAYDAGSPNMLVGGNGDRLTTVVLFGSF